MTRPDALLSAALRRAFLCSCALFTIGCPGAEPGATSGDGTGDAGSGDDDQGTGSDGSGPDESGGPSSEGDDGSDDGVTDTGSDPTTLDDDVFFFVREMPEGDALWVYDLGADAAHEASPLDGTSAIRSVAIHPSRTAVSFSSYYGAVDHQDSETIYAFDVNDALVFGEPTVLMPAFPKPGEVADGYNQQIGYLRWHPDGTRLWFEHAVLTDFLETGGAGIVGLDLATGDVDVYPDASGNCAVNLGPSPSPDGSVMLVVRDACIDTANEGIAAFDVPPVGDPQLIAPAFEPVFSTPRWLPDGSGVVYGAAIDDDSDGDGTNDVYGEALILLDIATGDQFVLLAPTAQAFISKFTLSPVGDRAVVCVRQESAHDLLLLDYSVDPPELRWLTDDGVSCTPEW